MLYLWFHPRICILRISIRLIQISGLIHALQNLNCPPSFAKWILSSDKSTTVSLRMGSISFPTLKLLSPQEFKEGGLAGRRIFPAKFFHMQSCHGSRI